MILFALTGIKPFPKPYKITKERYIGEFPKSILKIEISEKINIKKFSKIFPKAQGFLKPKGKKLNEKHERLYRLVEKHGGVPRTKGIMKFWEKMQDKWNMIYPEEKYKSSRGLRKAYITIKNRLKD